MGNFTISACTYLKKFLSLNKRCLKAKDIKFHYLISFLLIIFSTNQISFASDPASDNASNYSGGGSFTATNGGTGFGVWASVTGGGGGFFRGASVNNGSGGGGVGNGIDVSGNSWGFFTSGGTLGTNFARATRTFTGTN